MTDKDLKEMIGKTPEELTGKEIDTIRTLYKSLSEKEILLGLLKATIERNDLIKEEIKAMVERNDLIKEAVKELGAISSYLEEIDINTTKF